MIAFNRTKDLRRSLRKNKTNAEKIVWTCLKSKQIGGYKFRRQHGIGKYIVDFYQLDSKLIIEIDGDVHFITADQEKKDIERQKWFESMGYKILRFNNVDIFNNLENILDEIYRAVRERLTPPNLPLKGEGAMATPPLFLRRGFMGEVNFGLARGVVATDNTVAIRVTAHPLLKSITEKIGRPLVATSANISDAGDMYSSAAVIEMFKNREVRPDIILDLGNLPKNPPSTIASVVNGNLKILRQGAVYIEI
jgi:very-short-patch-repair endonuclease